MSRKIGNAGGRTEDRRAIRTRSVLRSALIELIAERGWDDIAVHDICKRANVGRSTFYLHYDSKNALLAGGLEDLRNELRGGSAPKARGGAWSGFQFVLGLAQHIDENQHVFRSLVGRRSGYVVQQRFRDMLVKLIDEELPGFGGVLPKGARARCLAALLTELLGWWVDQGSVPARQIADQFNRVAAALLCRV